MSIYGKTEVAYFELTPRGVQAVQNPRKLSRLDPGSRTILRGLADNGGTLEWDELKFMGATNAPNATAVALRRLIDLGYVRPTTLEQG